MPSSAEDLLIAIQQLHVRAMQEPDAERRHVILRRATEPEGTGAAPRTPRRVD